MRNFLGYIILLFGSVICAYAQDDYDWKTDFKSETNFETGKIETFRVLYPHPDGDPTIIRPPFSGTWVGIGTSSPSFPLSLGSSTARTKFALYETGPGNSYGLGVTSGAFRLHLNGPGARFAFFNSDEKNAQEVFTIFGNGRTRTRILEITGGSDLAEPFVISGNVTIRPGMVVSIDAAHPGQLRISGKAYDRTVAGIISGANGLNPGLTMKQEGSIGDAGLPVALTGRVYCWADAGNGPIQPGDLLTPSDTPGHSMKVTDYAKAQGAIIGKAMSALEAGKGLVLVLVSLQ